MANFLLKRKNILKKSFNRKSVFQFLGLSILFFLIGSLIAPIYNGRNFLEVMSEELSMEEEKMEPVADEDDYPLNPVPYFYEDFKAPENSFGIKEMTIKTVNWSLFKQLFNAHTYWQLEYDIGNGWTEGNQYLEVEKTWHEGMGSWKINLTFNNPSNQYVKARFTFACDLPVLNYAERDGWSVYLNYTVPNTNEQYNVFFDWSDLQVYENLWFNKGKTDDLFWFRFGHDDIPPQSSWTFDPEFGFDTYAGGSFMVRDDTLVTPMTSYISGWVTDCTMRCDAGTSSGSPFNAGLYTYEDVPKLLTAWVDSHHCEAEAGEWHTEDVNVTAIHYDTQYYLAGITDTVPSMGSLFGDGQPGIDAKRDLTAYDGTFEGQLALVDATDEGNLAQYYTVFPAFDEEYPSDDSYNISLTPTASIKIQNYNDTSSTVDWYFSTDGVTYNWVQTNTSFTAGDRVECVFSDATNYNTVYYWKVYQNDGSDNFSSIPYNFETTCYQPTFYNDTFISEHQIHNSHNLTYDSDGYYNLSYGYVDDGGGIDVDADRYDCGQASDESSWVMNRVRFNTIDDSDSAEYDYVDNTDIMTSVAIGKSYTMTINAVVGSYNWGRRVWFDWNNDSDFGDAGESFDIGSVNNNAEVSDTITVPATAVEGANIVMRVAYDYGKYPPTPCEDVRSGDVKDYSIYIMPYQNDGYFLTQPIYRQDDAWDKAYFTTNNTGATNVSLVSENFTIEHKWLNVNSNNLLAYSDLGYFGHDIDDALDGTNYWDANTYPQQFVLDLGQNYTINTMRGRSELGQDPDDVSIWVSEDNTTWKPFASNISTWQDTNTWVEVEGNAVYGRYVKVKVESTESGGGASDLNWGDIPYITIFDIEVNGTIGGEVYMTDISNGEDISSITASSLRYYIQMNDDWGSIRDIQTTWTSGGEEETWQTIGDDTNGTFLNTTLWKDVDTTLNGTFFNTTVFQIVTDSINGTFNNLTAWYIINNDINGSFINSTNWNIIQENINGSFINSITWQTIDDTVNGSFRATTEWSIVSEDINGSFFNTTNWNTVIDSFNGSFFNTTVWNIIESSLNGSFFNTTSYQIINDEINGTFNGVPNSPVQTANETPLNNSIYYSLLFDYSFDIFDLNDDTFNYWVNCSNNVSVSGNTGDARIYLNSLIFNCTDSTGSYLVKEHYDIGQGFKYPKEIEINSVELKLLRGGTPGTCYVTIRNLSGGKPYHSEIINISFNGDSLTTSAAGEWKRFYFEPFIINASEEYVLCLEAPNGDAGNYLKWRWKTPRYIDTYQYQRYDAGWSTGFQYTHDFRIHTVNLSSNTLYWVNITGNDGVDVTYDKYKFTTYNVNPDWQIVEDSINGTFLNYTYWNIIDDTINGSFINQTNWQIITDTVNGSFVNTTNWKVIDDTINGSFNSAITWKVIDDSINGSFYNYTGGFGPTITLNRAGTISEDYVNNSFQTLDYIYINATVIDEDAFTVYLHWTANNSWDNTTYTLSNSGGDFYEITMSNLLNNTHYSFDIYAEDEYRHGNTTTWKAETTDNNVYTRKFVRVGAGSYNYDLNYTCLYLYKTRVENAAKLDFEQIEGTGNDTGMGRFSLPGETIPDGESSHVHCGIIAGFRFGESIPVDDWTITNYYSHFWVWTNVSDPTTNYSTIDENGGGLWYTEKALAQDYMFRSNTPADITVSPQSNEPETDEYYIQDSYNLFAGLKYELVSSTTYDANDIYDLTFGFIGEDINMVTNRSYVTCVFLNLPNNETLNETDTDADNINDYDELFVYYTLPNLEDTDNDGINDYWEIQAGSDPNNYTETFNITTEWQVVNDNFNGSFYNLTEWTTINDGTNGTFYNTTVWSIIDDTINGSFINTTIFQTINDGTNGTFYNTTEWAIIDDVINGSFYNLTEWIVIDESLNGTFFNTTTYQIIDDSINGTFYNTTTWLEIDNSINGSFYNLTSFSTINADINGSFTNTTTWQIIHEDINGSFYNVSIPDSAPILSNEFPSNNTGGFSIPQIAYNWVNGSYGPYATRVPYQQKTFYAEGRFWIFFSDYVSSYKVYYTSSEDGQTWEEPTYVCPIYLASAYLDSYYDGNYIYLALKYHSTYDPRYYKGTLDGTTGEINWIDSFEAIDVASNIGDPSIVTNSTGAVFVGVKEKKSALFGEPYVFIRHLNDTWTQFKLNETFALYQYFVCLLNLTNEEIYAIYFYSEDNEELDNYPIYGRKYNGNTWEDQEVVTTLSPDTTKQGRICAVNNEDTIHLVLLENVTENITYVKYSEGIWQEPVVLVENKINCSPVIDIDRLTNNLYVTFQEENATYYVKYENSTSTWDLNPIKIYNDTNDLERNDVLSSSHINYQNYISYMYISNTSAPRQLKHFYRNVNTTELEPQCNITIGDPENQLMTLEWYENTTGTWVLRQTNSSCTNGTYSWIYTNADEYDTKYWWKIKVSDGENEVEKIYVFTTGTSEEGLNWQTVDNTINGTFSNSTTWLVIDATINGSFTNITAWTIIENSLNGTFSNSTTWNTIDNQINGTFSNSTNWIIIHDSLNGSFYNSSIWQTITEEINGTFYNITSYQIISDSLNGSFYNLTKWTIIEDTINGTFTNLTQWIIIEDTLNGTFYNSTSWIIIDNQINGTFSNSTVWSIIDDTINGTFRHIKRWQTIDDTINGKFINYSYWTIIEDTINGSFYNVSGIIIKITEIYAENQSEGIPTNPTLHITVDHTLDEQMNISWYHGNSSENTTHYLGEQYNKEDGTYYMAYPYAEDTFKKYYWRINISDGEGNWREDIYYFFTGASSGGDIVLLTPPSVSYYSYLALLGFLVIPYALYRRKKKKRREEEDVRSSMEQRGGKLF